MADIMTPALGESVSEATVARWAKKPGEAVRKDEILVELETDKVSLEVAAPADGVLESISAEEGATVEPGAVLGHLKVGASAVAVAPAAAPAPAVAPAAPKAAKPAPAVTDAPGARGLTIVEIIGLAVAVCVLAWSGYTITTGMQALKLLARSVQ